LSVDTVLAPTQTGPNVECSYISVYAPPFPTDLESYWAEIFFRPYKKSSAVNLQFYKSLLHDLKICLETRL
jgi:hypothetical protein